MATERTIRCTRCSTDYVVPTGAWLPACPKCGRAPVSLRHRIRSNRVSAVLACCALIVLFVAFPQPFVTMEKLGTRTTYSLVGGVGELYARGYAVIATVLLVFSVLFPIAKLIALLVATSRFAPVSLRTRRLLHKTADLTGKYSMLDVLVVAVIIVLVRFQSLAHVEAHGGVVWFTAAVLLSMAAGLCVALPEKDAEPT